jgi:N6-L-threonylcarbamoyladenine synthase
MILAVESSCDESALALFDPAQGLVGEWVHSQIEKHQPYGGIVPDLASREHLRHFPRLLRLAQEQLGDRRPETLAVTSGPGLAGCLALGLSLAQALALAWKRPLVGVNHLRGHAFSPFIAAHAEDPAAFRERFAEWLPHLGLIVSGGNTILFEVRTDLTLKILAETLDDAAGEALDKGAKLLGMPYPGGPLIEKKAVDGQIDAFAFPRAFLNSGEAKFSFSGLKTSLRYTMEEMSDETLEAAMPDLCASYQAAVVDALAGKTRQILRRGRGRWRSLGLSGGVANNRALREAFGDLAERSKLPLFLAQPKHTGDNAAMIAFAAWLNPDGCRQSAAGAPLSFEPSWTLA